MSFCRIRPSAPPRNKHPVGNHDAHLAGAFAGGLDHVGDEGEVALRLGRHTAVVAVEGVVAAASS
jgi:hypothetical protein